MSSSHTVPLRQYAVFISCRHADNKEMGRKWANWLHEALEGYEIPPDLVGTLNMRGEKVPPSLYPVFRDEEELPADADLSTNICRALDNSALLVVLCSPRAVQSRFVADEIRYFKEIGKSHSMLVTTSRDGVAKLWDVDEGQQGYALAPQASTLRVAAFSHQGTLVAAGAEDGSVPVFDLGSRQLVALLAGHATPVTAVRFSADGNTIVSAAEGGAIKVWHLPTARAIKTLQGEASDIRAMALSPDGTLLATVGTDRVLTVWDLASSTPRMISGKSGWFLREISFVCLGGWMGAASWFWLMVSPKRHKKLLRRKSSARRTERKNMKTEKLDDLDRYVAERMKRNPEFAEPMGKNVASGSLGRLSPRPANARVLPRKCLPGKSGPRAARFVATSVNRQILRFRQ